MIFYREHIGNKQIVLADMTPAQRGIYDSLVLRYLQTEQPLPGSLSKLEAIAGVRTSAERRALHAVLDEHFELSEDGDCWHNDFCDQILAEYLAGQPAQNTTHQNKAGRDLKHKARKREMRERLSAAGVPVNSDMSLGLLRDLAARHKIDVSDIIGGAPATPSATGQRRPGDAPATPPHKPVANSQTNTLTADSTGVVGGGGDDVDDEKTGEATPPASLPSPPATPPKASPEASPVDPFEAVALKVSESLKAADVLVHHGDARLRKLLGEGAVESEFLALAPAATKDGINDRGAWLLKTLANQRASGPRPAGALVVVPASAAPTVTVPSKAAELTAELIAKQDQHKPKLPNDELRAKLQAQRQDFKVKAIARGDATA